MLRGGYGLRHPSSNTLMTCSTDFTAPSMSCSYSHSNLFSHNPSCSLTRNSTGNYEHSVRGGIGTIRFGMLGRHKWSVPVMSQIVQELSEEVMESTKSYLRSILDVPERSEELAGLQRKLDKRSDLTKETLTKCNKDQLLILVAVRTGLGSFLSGKNKIPNAELVEIFLFLRCRNVNCKMLLPLTTVSARFARPNSGFCSSCMCPVCLKFDCASNTCSWVGCDMCSHWCHASCGIQKNLISPAQNAKSGAAEMHYLLHGL
ncbi:hypothetical protein MLD38_025134 [Melastoma candidum]|uniref:Uncharacterized protein n=1 Tax=Melastoma candidum TaxID=119954 RepID=A0ACB9NUW1_9MYRT|nr:hypothetical protein MLD38_025134 [Melastoma candidum]